MLRSVVFLNPRALTLEPQSQDEDEFRVFKDARQGSRCNMSSTVNTSNAFGCWWDVDSQSFAGPGCEIAASQECACTHLT